MARALRVDFAGARHHVMNRGLRKQRIFRSERDYREFLGLVSKLPQRFGVEVHGYALMPNHYHLMLRCPGGNLSQAMHWLGQVWTQRVNARNEWDGPIFRGRFRSCLVDSDVYWGYLLAYLHLNPVRAGNVDDVGWARWTSHRAYVKTRPHWLSTHELMDWHGGPDGVDRYVRGIADGSVEVPDGAEAATTWRGRSSVASTPIRRGEVHLPVEQAADLVRELAGCPWQIQPARVGETVEAAVFSAWVMHRLGRVPQRQIAREWGISQAAVAKRVARCEAVRHGSDRVWAWFGELERRHRLIGRVRVHGVV